MITGSLATMPPFELLQWLGMSRKTGTLTVSNGKVEKKITFEEGWIISSASSDPNDFLGFYLVQHDVITAEEQVKARELQEQIDISLGKILVMIHALTEEELIQILRDKAEDEIASVFGWPRGTFAFDPSAVASTRETVALQIDVARVLLEGSRRADERTRFRKALTDESWDTFEVDFHLNPEAPRPAQVIGDDGQLPRFHRPACPALKVVSEEGRTPFKSSEEAVDAGYARCGECVP